MAEICQLENRHKVIFSAVGSPIWIKFRRLVQNDMLTTVIWSKSKPEAEFQYGIRLGEFSVTIPEPRVTLQGAATWRIQCLDHRAICHIAGCCHLANSVSWCQSHMPHCRNAWCCHIAHVPHCRMLSPGKFSDMSSLSHMPECRVLPSSEFTVMISEPRATLQGERFYRPYWKFFSAIFYFLFS